MKTYHTISATFAVIAVSAGVALQAQDYSGGIGNADIERRLGVDSVLFNATINRSPDDDMIELGRLVAMGGAGQGGSGMACINCHGVEGEGDGSGAFPRLDGQGRLVHVQAAQRLRQW